MFRASTDQIVIWPYPKQFSKVTKSNRSVGLEAKVAVVMSRCQVTAFTEKYETEQKTDRSLFTK